MLVEVASSLFQGLPNRAAADYEGLHSIWLISDDFCRPVSIAIVPLPNCATAIRVLWFRNSVVVGYRPILETPRSVTWA